MDKSILLKYLMGDVVFEFLIAFYVFALLGVVLSMLFHYGEKRNKDKKVNKVKSFNFIYWFKDNIVRLLTSIICIFIVVRFYSELPIAYELNMFLGLLTGASLDRVIVFIRNRTTIGIFQTKS